MRRAQLATAAVSGFLLALGLAFGQLTRPEVIIGWVDFSGDWNPQMLIFFVAAAVVYHGFLRLAEWRERAAGGPTLCLPKNRRVDAPLLIGSTIFGVGWAVAGACPGPALASLGAGAPWAVVFVAAMALGMRLRASADH